MGKKKLSKSDMATMSEKEVADATWKLADPKILNAVVSGYQQTRAVRGLI
jgi:hypothetical protein